MKRLTLAAFLLAPTAWLVTACGESPTHPASTDPAVEPSFSDEPAELSEDCARLDGWEVVNGGYYGSAGIGNIYLSEGEVLTVTAWQPGSPSDPSAIELTIGTGTPPDITLTAPFPGTLTYEFPAEGYYALSWSTVLPYADAQWGVYCGLNHPPEAVDDAYPAYEGVVLTVPAPGVQANDFDEDGDPLTTAGLSGPPPGSVALGAFGQLTYTPPSGFSGEYRFTYNVSDGILQSNWATVTITVYSLITIDVKPDEDGDGKPINLKSNGVVPVAILGSDTFDPTTAVVPESLVFVGALLA
ncbi:MAG: Ig-like domain-containing protein, partial [Gemmatimonadota bacterium]